MTPDLNSTLPKSVFVAQASNDQAMLLRDPLASNMKDQHASLRANALAIIGGTTRPVYKLGQEAFSILSNRVHDTRLFDRVEDFASSNMTRATSDLGVITVLCLTDLDKPYLGDTTADKFDALKMMWATAGTLVWVTRGSRDAAPYSHMMGGIVRTVKTEYPNLNLQMFDHVLSKSRKDCFEPTQADTIGSGGDKDP
ncbi:polyketide synthase [Hirsutella rhossiliensis]|uniref:Polyketide synthase n=1 Tax=Hirsutella rhossiliensis TaxID=111463 RepID=A0A9P8MUS5_9HYPO|nr:polyketide synthase [Hirsutella rhossiliensis]KAH0961787.1 polyketide synthase [Hirsutella rhossiliensis]